MPKDFPFQAVAAGLLAAFVGFASSFAVIVHGLIAVGATQAQAASGLMTLSVVMGLCGAWLSLRLRMPISVAWSTPGAALLVTTGMAPGGFPAAVGAFLVCGLLIVLAGLWRPLGAWVAALPPPLSNAMLAGVLLGMCLAPVHALAEAPALAAPVVAVWALVARWRRIWAVPAAVAMAAVGIAATAHVGALGPLWTLPAPVTPTFSLTAMVGIAAPLFIVTMASQNIPGMAVLRLNGYRPPPGRLFRATGLASAAAALFGSHAICLAAITAALAAGPDAHPDPARRYWAGVTASLAYIVFGLFAGPATGFIAASPPILIEAVAGLALLGAFGGSLMAAVADPETREPAIVTFLVSASGVSLAGIGGAFWGLLAGGAMLALARWRRVDSPRA